jgi:nicotinamidase-related amidase
MRSFGVLIVIDVQRGFDDTRWGRRGNPGCERNVAALIAVWRQRNGTIVFVRHDSQAQESPLYSGSPGNAFKPEIDGEPDLLVVKHVNSAFYGSLDLHAWLQDHGHHALTICGITTNHCCETTARMAGNLGYETTFAIDATHTFDRRSVDGSWISAEEIARVSAANLTEEFATVITTAAIIAASGGDQVAAD